MHSTPPTASTLNYTPGVNIANATTVALNAAGEVCVYTSTTSHYALDVVAFFPAGSDVGTVVPARLLDTRSKGETVDGRSKVPESPGRNVHEGADRRRGEVPADAVGVELNITAIQNEGRGFATLYPCTATPPTASTLNYTPGVNIANATTVALNTQAKYASTPPPPPTTRSMLSRSFRRVRMWGPWFRHVCWIPVRTVRPLTASSKVPAKSRPETFIKVQIAGRGGVPADAVGVELNITAIQNEGRGFATLYPCTAERRLRRR